MQKMLYIVNQRIPTEKAYGIQITKMCEAFADAGLEVTLLAPRRGRGEMPDLFDYYSVKRNFVVQYLKAPDFYWPGKLDFFAFWIKNFFSALALARYASKQKADIIYSRDELPLYFASFLNTNSKLVFEAHKFSNFKKILYDKHEKTGVKLISITDGLAKEFVLLGFKTENIMIAPDAVDEKELAEAVSNPLSKEKARQILGLPFGARIAIYTGSLYLWKGVYCLADTAKLLPDVDFVVVGGGQGENEFRSYLKKKSIKNIILTGYQKGRELLRLYRAAADVLLLPNTAKEKLSEIYTSPLKLFSYMASLRPIVASDLPSIREILSEDNAILVKPDDPQALAGGIKVVLGSPDLAKGLSIKAFEKVKQYTWEKRAESILSFIF